MKFIGCMASLVVLMLLTGSVQGAPPKQELGAIYARLDGALENGDPQTLTQLLAPGAILKTADGKVMKREAYLKLTAQMPQLMQGLDIKSTLGKISVSRNKWVVLATSRSSGTLQDRQGNPHRYTSVSTSRDTWVKSNAKWMLQSSIGLKHSATLDGKPFRRP